MSFFEQNAKSIVDLIKYQSATSPDMKILTFVKYEHGKEIESTLTYRDIDMMARRIASNLREKGVRAGDRILCLSTQSEEDVYSIFGSLYAGATFILIPPPSDTAKRERFLSVLDSSKPKFMLTSNLLLTEVCDISRLMLLTNMKEDFFVNIDGTEQPAESVGPIETDPESLAYIQYSSGSTSSPKGVMVTHRNLLSNMKSIMEVSFKAENPVKSYLAWAPFFHNVSLINLFIGTSAAIPMVWMRPSDFMEKPLRWFEQMTRHKTESTFGPNSAFNFCARSISKKDLDGIDISSLKLIANGSEPVDLCTLELFTEAFRDVGMSIDKFVPGYGLAEVTSMATSSRDGVVFSYIDGEKLGENKFVKVEKSHPRAKTIVSAGHIGAGFKMITVHPDTLEICGEGEIGELWIQGPSVAKGYWQAEEATKETFCATNPSSEGLFLRTGDLAYLDGRVVYITGRMKEVIIINGHNFYSSDIQETVKKSVSELKSSTILTFSVLRDKKEKVVTCVETLKRHKDEDLDVMARSIVDIISKTYEFSPDDIIFAGAGTLPRTDNGKIQLLKAKKLYTDGLLPSYYSLEGRKESPSQTAKKPRNDLERQISEIFCDLLKPANEIGIDDNFFMLGGDSIAMVQLAARIRETFGIEIPIKFLLNEPNVEKVADLVEQFKRGVAPSEIKIKKANLYEECRLDETIVPAVFPEGTKFMPPKNVFLTGGTGFVGAYLIKEIMENTDARIYCLVRAKDRQTALSRIRENSSHFLVWDESYASRIIPVLGELSKPLMGIDRGEFEELSTFIDTIYHNGAMLNFIYPYERLKGINVIGTEECLRLACLNRPKYFHHVSTFSVFDNPSYFKKTALESDPLESPDGYFLGYTESKWVAEKLVRIAMDRGLSAAIYRPGEISGAADTGIWKMSDAVIRNLVSCVQMNAMPDIDTRFHITPVDYVAKGIVLLSLQENSLGKAFHLVNNNIKSIDEIAKFLRKFGYPLESVTFDEWKKRLFAADEKNAMKPLEELFREKKKEGEEIHRRYGELEAFFSVEQAEAGLRKAGVSCDPLDDKLLTRYFNYFIKAGYIESPRT
ncbi:MAG: thioester reductase domain-containing protein [Oligoflexales bacterium]|nr:thioester reductase domain-containing protein [Oligoflexales bacterium]